MLGGPLSARGVDVIDGDGLGRNLVGLVLDRVLVLVVDVHVPEHDRVETGLERVPEDRDLVALNELRLFVVVVFHPSQATTNFYLNAAVTEKDFRT